MPDDRLEKARFVRVSKTGDLVFSLGGREMAVSVDDTLERAILEAKQVRSEMRQAPQPHQQSTLPISQIQSLIRAGADLITTVDVTLKPFERALVPTGVAIALPAGYVALVHPRSGLAAKQGVTVLNAPGTVDAGYRGEIKVPLINLDPKHTAVFHPGDRIAQLVIQRYVEARFIPAETLPGSDRAERGFGSTGVAS